MARPFTAKDAKRLIEKHSALLDRLDGAVCLAETYKQNICSASEQLAEQEIRTILEGVPVEELNREKNGFKTKTLRDYNFCTMADLYSATSDELAAIKGISDEGAAAIKTLVNNYARRTRETAKIRLSADNKSPAASQLVTAIAIYKNSLKAIEDCCKLLLQNRETINEGMEELRPAAHDLKWLFTSRSNKNRALVSYDCLNNLINGTYGSQTGELLYSLDQAAQTTNSKAWEDFTRDTVRFFTILEDIKPGLLGTDDTVYGLPEELAQEVQKEALEQEGLRCTLRRYQEWGVKYILHQEKVLLGDEMGLGKTVQAIAAMVSLQNTGVTHFTVVCPASVLTNWCREIEKHSTLKVTKVHGGDRDKAFNSWIKTGGVAVTTYETTGYFQLEEHFQFSLLVVDEAHYIKNPEAKRTANTVALCQHAERLLFMTGTALENKVDEMLALIRILQPDVAQKVQAIAFMASASQFREKIASVYYRRKREDVLTELPEKIESKEWCTLLPEEEKLYEEAVLAKKYTESRRVSWNVENLENSSKAQRLKELVEEAASEERKVIVFSFFLDTIRKISVFLGDRCVGPINGSVSPARRQEIIDEFDKAPAGSVLVAQIQSGGTGLNIQTASMVVICEPQFKPSVENQAISRAYRMGQARNVLVYRLLCDDTVDEKITELLENKQKIFDAFADTSVAAEESLELDEKTFGNIIAEEEERIKAKRESNT